jgi:hypothetical protein
LSRNILNYFKECIARLVVRELRGFARGLPPNEGVIYQKTRPMSRLFSYQSNFYCALRCANFSISPSLRCEHLLLRQPYHCFSPSHDPVNLISLSCFDTNHTPHFLQKHIVPVIHATFCLFNADCCDALCILSRKNFYFHKKIKKYNPLFAILRLPPNNSV